MSSYESVAREYCCAKVNNVIFNDRCGYAMIFYEPVYSHDRKIPALEKQDLLYSIPLQRKSLKPARQPNLVIEPDREKYESAKEFILRKSTERKISEIHETCRNIKNLYKKIENLDLERREFVSPHRRVNIRGKCHYKACDILQDDAMKDVNFVYERNLDETRRFLKRKSKRPQKPVTEVCKDIEEVEKSCNNECSRCACSGNSIN
jgi:predicted transcriptional regulator